MKNNILLSLLVCSLLSVSAWAQEEVSPEEATTATPAAETAPATPEATAAPAPAAKSVAQPPAKKALRSITTSAIGISSLQWNEPLLLKQAGKVESDIANYSGLSISYQKETIYYQWGWAFGGFLGTGRANGGGNVTSITYQKDKQAFTIIGLSPRIFYRITSRVSLGLTGLGYIRSVEWPTDTPGLSVDATRNFTLTALADVNLRISDKLDFYQGIGPLDKGATFWKIGLAYRMP